MVRLYARGMNLSSIDGMSTRVLPHRRFVPADLSLSDWNAIAPVAERLQEREIHSAAELEAWLADFSELCAAVDEYGSRAYINKSCHTDDRAIEKIYLQFVENVEPPFKPVTFELQKKFLASPFLSELKGQRYEMLIRNWKAEVDLFRSENVGLETKIARLVNEYDKMCGSMMIDFRGTSYTPPQMARFLEDPDRTTREEAWKASANRRLVDRVAMDELFDEIRALRIQMAKNAGLDDFRAYAFKSKQRFDYTPEDCLKFADAVEKCVVPLVRKLAKQRKERLNVDVLRPWDLAVDPDNRPALSPFDARDIPGFVSKTRQVFERLSPDLARDFDQLKEHGNLDLESRGGKQPGGYQSSLHESKQPFIFMNAAGLHRDVETLLHEGGHAFHLQWAAAVEPLMFLRHAPMEFCEVASMSMEMLSMDHLDIFYGEGEEYTRARRKQLEDVIKFFPWMSTIDLFQHWIYTNPVHTKQERTDHWLSLMKRFGSGDSYEGIEEILECLWQRQLHLFHSPFYYVEYGIAQLGAMQMWLKATTDPKQALSQYRKALTLGGTRPLPELFKTAGLVFDFSEKTIAPLMKAIEQELENMPN